MNDLPRFFLAVIGLILGLVAFGSSFLTASFPSSLLVSLPFAITGFAISACTLVMQRRAGESTNMAKTGITSSILALVVVLVWGVVILLLALRS